MAKALAEMCHDVQAQASAAIRRNSEALNAVLSALDRSLTVTMSVGRVLEEALRGLEYGKKEHSGPG